MISSHKFAVTTTMEVTMEVTTEVTTVVTMVDTTSTMPDTPITVTILIEAFEINGVFCVLLI